MELPGWGSWAGAGASKPKKPAKPKVVTKMQKQSNVPGLKHVIVSERAVKATAKYSVDRVPYPFVSAEQYERAMKQPLGPDWNTQSVFNKHIRPAVVVKAGAVIDPISWTSQSKKRSFEVEQGAKSGDGGSGDILRKKSKMGRDRTSRKL